MADNKMRDLLDEDASGAFDLSELVGNLGLEPAPDLDFDDDSLSDLLEKKIPA